MSEDGPKKKYRHRTWAWCPECAIRLSDHVREQAEEALDLVLKREGGSDLEYSSTSST